MGEYQSGQMGQTVNLLVFTFGGSNPSSPTESPTTYRSGFYFEKRNFRLKKKEVCFGAVRGTTRQWAKRNKKAEVAQSVEHQPSKLRVAGSNLVFRSKLRQCSSGVERFLGKEEVASSILATGSAFFVYNTLKI